MLFVVLEERKLYLSWKDCIFLWNAEERTGDCIFFLFSVLLKRNKYCSINLWRTDMKLFKSDGCSSITFFFFCQVQSWSFVCVARKSSTSTVLYFLFLFDCLFHKSVRRKEELEKSKAVLTATLLWLQSTEYFCFFCSISCICCVYPIPTRIFSWHLELKD